MHIRQLFVENYKSFLSETSFEFEPGFNILIGANSSGKSSVIECLNLLHVQNTPHRSVLNIRDTDSYVSPNSKVSLAVVVSPDEVIKATGGLEAYIGIGDQTGSLHSNNLDLINSLLTDGKLEVHFRRVGQDMAARLVVDSWPAMWRRFASNTGIPAAILDPSTRLVKATANVNAAPQDVQAVFNKYSAETHYLSSERQVQAVFAHQGSGELNNTAANLAFCINHLQSHNSNLFARLNEFLHRIFPTIHWVGAPPNGNGQFELLVHTNPTSSDRGDLAVPINKVGTGVGNALAMLYIALTARTPRVLLLEEPNSYLHPRALRELLSILAEIGSQHQYFVTSHSADVLRTIDPATVTLLEYDGRQTAVRQTKGSSLHSLRAGLIDVGIRLTDLHGCDSVLWVEGETEEAVMPILLRRFAPAYAGGIAVLPLHSTGDFESRKMKPAKVAEIYRRLSQDTFLAPPMVAIALDRETRTDADVEEIEKSTAGLVRFLPRPMIEDYLLDADALVYLLQEMGETEIQTQAVEIALENARRSPDLALPTKRKPSLPHAANVLNFVLAQLTNERHVFRKTEHAPRLMRWLIENKPESLSELGQWLDSLLNRH